MYKITYPTLQVVVDHIEDVEHYCRLAGYVIRDRTWGDSIVYLNRAGHMAIVRELHGANIKRHIKTD